MSGRGYYAPGLRLDVPGRLHGWEAVLTDPTGATAVGVNTLQKQAQAITVEAVADDRRKHLTTHVLNTIGYASPGFGSPQLSPWSREQLNCPDSPDPYVMLASWQAH